MKAFKFNLEALYKYRKNIEKEKQAELAKVSSKYNKEKTEKEKCLSGIKHDILVFDNTQDKIENSDMVQMYMAVSDYIVGLRYKIKTHEEKMDKISVELREKQRILSKATTDRRAVEILKEKKLREHKIMMLKEEQKTMDEYKVRF